MLLHTLFLVLHCACALQVSTLPISADSPNWQTEVVVVDTEIDGPTVMLVAGMHGNEPAPPLAAKQIAGWEITKGRLVIIPRANVLALAINKRHTPDVDKARSDLNRQFPADDVPQTELANAIWSTVEKYQPSLLIDMHEGYDFHKINSDSVGSSVIPDKTEHTRELAKSMLKTVNTSISDEQKKFSLLRYPVAGSLARAVHEKLNIPAMIIETTKKDQAITFRARQQRHMVHQALADLEMIEHGPDVLIGSAGNDDDVAVAMYVSSGVSGSGPERLGLLLNEAHGFDLRRVCATDIRAGALDQFDVVIFPGGSGSGQAKSLTIDGREAVIDFVENGGGFVGICAGAYLASTGYEWSLGIVDAKGIDRSHWKRGRGNVDVEWTDSSIDKSLLNESSNSLKYANGPLYAPADVEAVPDYEVLAYYRSEINTNNAPDGIMLNTPAIVKGTFKDGTVICISPHPEQTSGCEAILRELILQAQ